MKNNPKNRQEIVIYQDRRGKVELRADVKKDTIWATQAQIANLFDTQRPAITKHLRNIFKTTELEEKAVCSILEHTATDGKKYQTQYYNLDAIIAVGYRVNSQKATQFRIWATATLRNYLLKGYVINKKRLEKTQAKAKELNSMIGFITKVRNKQLSSDEASGLLSVIKDYADSWMLLQKYDKGELKIRRGKQKGLPIEYPEAANAILQLKINLIQKGEAGDVFGQEREQSLIGILRTIHQKFDHKELYESLEEKAAHLLYFIIKDHPLIDGNKRTGVLYFCRKMNIFFDQMENEK